MSEHVAQITEILRKAVGKSDADVAMLEEAARIADVHNDIKLGLNARIRLLNTATFSGNYENALVAFSWCLAQLDRDEQLRPRYQRTVLWCYKWVAANMGDYAQISRDQITRTFEEMSDRYRRAGYGEGEVIKCKAHCANALGDMVAFAEYRELWLKSARESISDCIACKTNTTVEFDLHIGDLEGALGTAEPIIQGRQICTSVPCTTFGHLLLPLLKLGSVDLADKLHRAKFSQAISNRSYLLTAGRHCAYLGLVGRFTKGIEVFETCMPWLMMARRTWDRMNFVQNAAVLFERLAERGDDRIQLRIPNSAPFYRADDTYIPSTVANSLEQMRAELASQFNQRNGNTEVDRKHRAFRDLVDSIRIPQVQE